MKLNIKPNAKHAAKLIQESSPTILSGIAVVGVAGTAYLTWKASRQHNKVVYLENANRGLKNEKYTTPKEELGYVWKFYIPAVVSGTLTIVCIVAANRVQARRLAALAAGYAVLSGDFDDYRSKASEMLGVKKSGELDEKRVQETVAARPIDGNMIVPEGKAWFLDMTTKRYHLTTMESVKAAQNELNYTINHNDGDCSLNDFYAQLGMDSVGIGDKLGWNGSNRVEVKFTAVLTEDRGAVTAFDFVNSPLPNFWKH